MRRHHDVCDVIAMFETSLCCLRRHYKVCDVTAMPETGSSYLKIIISKNGYFIIYNTYDTCWLRMKKNTANVVSQISSVGCSFLLLVLFLVDPIMKGCGLFMYCCITSAVIPSTSPCSQPPPSTCRPLPPFLHSSLHSPPVFVAVYPFSYDLVISLPLLSLEVDSLPSTPSRLSFFPLS